LLNDKYSFGDTTVNVGQEVTKIIEAANTNIQYFGNTIAQFASKMGISGKFTIMQSKIKKENAVIFSKQTIYLEKDKLLALTNQENLEYNMAVGTLTHELGHLAQKQLVRTHQIISMFLVFPFVACIIIGFVCPIISLLALWCSL
jgi:hypothetical protein